MDITNILPLPRIGIFGKKEEKEEPMAVKYRSRLLDYLTSPSKVVIKPDHLQIDKFHRVICAVNYPRLVEAGWLSRLVEMNLDFDLAIHIEPYPVEKTIRMLEEEIKKQKTDIYSLESEGKIVPQSLIQKHKDTKALLEAVQSGAEKMFGISLYIDAKGYDFKSLEDTDRKIRDKMSALLITPKIPTFRMYEALRSVLPVCDNQLRIIREVTSSAVAACFPFVISSLESKARGIIIGFNVNNDIPIIIDPFDLSNPNILVLGTSGGGKSYAIKLMLIREFLEGVDINVIDPQGEYTELAKIFNGKTIKIAPGSDTVINPFDLMGQSLDEKKLSLLAFFRIVLGELTEAQRAILDDAIDAVYEDAGITQDPKTWSKTPPTIEDLYNQIIPLTRSDKEIIYEPAMAIANRLKIYVTGPLRFLNQQTKINLDNRFITFDIRDIPDVGKPALMFLILEYIYNQMKRSRKRKILVIDEAWTVLSAGEEGEYILRIVKTCRKFNLSLVMITQDVEDVLTSRAGRAVLGNTATKLLLRQDPSVIKEVAERFNLSEKEQRFLQTARVGQALLIAERMRVPIKIQASPEEHRVITTKPDELLELMREKKRRIAVREMQLELDVTKPIHRKAHLTNEQVDALVKIGYKEIRIKNLEGEYELLIIRNETDYTDERFVLQHLIKEEIMKYTQNVMIHYSKLADISFEAADGRMVGIEVVAEPNIDEDIKHMEEMLPVLKRYNDYFFVVAREELKRETSYGTILTREEVPDKIRSYFVQKEKEVEVKM
ncbi:MAG: hypothetical protein DRO65_00635 [Candidatus Altiarchaeales archaeon]|nr:MAG: hypothetical protein DRO65_00635 [Candidatus Altiarchaeales archaeon]